MSPEALRIAGIVSACMGLAAVAAITVAYLISTLLALGIAVFVIVFGLALEELAQRGELANELEVERIRRRRDCEP